MTKRRIALIATGGTIAGAAASSSQTLGYQAAALQVEHLLAAVPGLDALADLQAEQLFAIDSAHITAAHWLQLSARLNAVLADPAVDGAVVLHGTDTLEETAWFLHLTVRSDKPLVLTGAMRPATALSADGPMNLYHAVAAAAHPASVGLGTLVVFGDSLYSARGLQKRDSTPAAFDADQYGRLGLVKGSHVHLYQRPVRAHGDLPLPPTLPPVHILHAYADLPVTQIEAAAQGAAGLVFAGLGNGNLRPDWLACLARLRQQGIQIVRSSRVPNGTVIRDGEVADSQHGFVSGDNLPPPQARILLQLALAAGEPDLQGCFDRH